MDKSKIMISHFIKILITLLFLQTLLLPELVMAKKKEKKASDDDVATTNGQVEESEKPVEKVAEKKNKKNNEKSTEKSNEKETITKAEFLPKKFSAEFEHIHKSLINKKKKISNGRVDYKYPGNIRFEFLDPDKIILTSNKDNTWYYTAPHVESEWGEVSVNKTNRSKNPAKFFDLLVSGMEKNDYYQIKKKKNNVSIDFYEKIKSDTGINKAILHFKNEKEIKDQEIKELTFLEVKSIELFYTNNKMVTLNLKTVKTDSKLADNLFIFKIPEKTKVSNNKEDSI